MRNLTELCRCIVINFTSASVLGIQTVLLFIWSSVFCRTPMGSLSFVQVVGEMVFIMTHKGPDKVLRQMARAGPSWICYCCNWNYIWALFSIAGGETWAFTLKTWSWENPPEGKIVHRGQDQNSTVMCLMHSPQLTLGQPQTGKR